jgi:predicted nucleic acid-binding protein
MELVVDANVLVAGFLRSGTTRELLLDERLVLWSPEWGVIEAEQVLTTTRLRRRLGGLSLADVRSLLSQITTRIRLLPASTYQNALADALRFTPDQTDAPYLALALHLNVPLWSNDSALHAQRFVRIVTTQELIALLRGHHG